MPKKKHDKYNIICKIIEFAGKGEEITVYNMVKKLRGIGLDVEEETVRRILKELERFGILKFKEISISRTKKEKRVYSFIIPPDIARNMVKILFSSRNFLRETTGKIFHSVLVLVKDGDHSIVGIAGEQEFEKAVFNTALPLLMEAYKPEFFVLFFQKNVEGKNAHRFTAVIASSFGTFTCEVTETKEEPVIDKGNEGELDTLLRNLKFS